MQKVTPVHRDEQQNIARRRSLNAISESYPNAGLLMERIEGTQYMGCWEDDTTDSIIITFSENIFDGCYPIYVDVYNNAGKGNMTYLVDVPSAIA